MKLTTWNAEWLDYDWGVIAGKYAPGERLFAGTAPMLAEAQHRMAALSALVARLDPDILFLCEAPAGEAAALAFAAAVLPDYHLVTRPPGEDYAIGGQQWLWFLVRKTLAPQLQPRLLPVAVWRAFTAAESASIQPDGSWSVAMPRLQTIGEVRDVPVATRGAHRFYRHPQVLRFTFGGVSHEVIGAHLKSKFVKQKPRARRPDEDFEDYAKLKTVQKYLAKSHAARIKLTSEAQNIRSYIDHRFRQEADPSIILVGDINDGPGKELMEREYLLHDMISNLQGEVFFARQFLNHALFDQPQATRWTAEFDDLLDRDRDPRILLDHILFTQGLTRSGTSPLIVGAGAGRVEHLAFEETEAVFGAGTLSDHRPVSVLLTPRAPG